MKVYSAWSGHDCSFCVLDEGDPVVHAEYERYIREKEPAGDGVQFMFDEWGDCDDMKYFATCHSVEKLVNYKESFEKLKGILKKNDGKFFVLGHHQCHAANAFYSSNLDEALIVTMDGGGFETENKYATAFTVWSGKGNKIEHLHTYPLSEVNIGGVWTRVTRYVFKLQSGWPRGHQAGTVMAMAALGDPKKYYDDFYKMLEKDSSLVSFKPPGQPRGAYVGTDPEHPYLNKWAKIAEVSEQNRFDLAAGLQAATEDYMRKLFSKFLDENPNLKNVCLSGGVSLNSVAMGKMLDWFGDRVEKFYVTPTPHDGGLTIGAAQYVWHHILDKPRNEWKDNCTPYLGVLYNNGEVAQTINKFSDEVSYRTAEEDEVIDLLDKESIIAVFGGGSESGRRALGNRSILADPRNPKMKDKINEKVKHRQWFRPFAPSILAEEIKNWFERDIQSPYMSFVLRFKEESKDKVPAVVHFNGTARLQSVSENDNKWYYNFIKKWQKKSGVPILLNTSFNDREPICETPEHAIRCYLKTEIDYLYFYEQKLLVERKQ
tara:strand:- start:1000 stop:2634 length:1635 start_codon:yes stop_codon:yes gene_type:complete